MRKLWEAFNKLLTFFSFIAAFSKKNMYYKTIKFYIMWPNNPPFLDPAITIVLNKNVIVWRALIFSYFVHKENLSKRKC